MEDCVSYFTKSKKFCEEYIKFLDEELDNLCITSPRFAMLCHVKAILEVHVDDVDGSILNYEEKSK